MAKAYVSMFGSGGDALPTTAAFLPSDIAGLQVWLRKGVGQTVSQWDDQSGNTRHMAMTASPTLSGGVYTFDGISQRGKVTGFTLNQPETVFMVVRIDAWIVGKYMHDGNAGDDMNASFFNVTPNYALYAGGSVVENANLAVGGWRGMLNVFNGASSIARVGDTTEVTGDAGSANGGGFAIASKGDGLAGFAQVSIAECGVYSVALNSSQREQLMDYLQAIASAL